MEIQGHTHWTTARSKHKCKIMPSNHISNCAVNETYHKVNHLGTKRMTCHRKEPKYLFIPIHDVIISGSFLQLFSQIIQQSRNGINRQDVHRIHNQIISQSYKTGETSAVRPFVRLFCVCHFVRCVAVNIIHVWLKRITVKVE